MTRGAALVEGAWSGEAAFLIGGGPSLKNLDWSLLKSHSNIIVVNRAYRDCQHADIFFSEDIQFLAKFSQEPDWKTFEGLKVFHALAPEFSTMARECDPDLYIINRTKPEGQKFWSKSFVEGLSISSNSAIGALNILDLLGADPIYLLGIDCNKNGKVISNYHSDYPVEWSVNGAQLESFASDFEYWAAPHLRHRVVINLNKDSAVRAWPKTGYTYNQALKYL